MNEQLFADVNEFARANPWLHPVTLGYARFVEGLRQLNGVVAGTTGMPWHRFVVFNAIGAVLGATSARTPPVASGRSALGV
jgi:membrane protein DedA with SNARE-associated domain